MLNYNKFTLDNGLMVIHHEDRSTPFVAVNTLYDVGARDEVPSKTGFAHLFEHLMFGGSIHIPDYDQPLQMAGGSNNAYTTNDITNYYIKLPKENIETALWLESDRMLSLAFSPQSLEVQRKVVCEEFKENYLNKPYGDVWKHLRALVYKVHPYQWMTIGKDLKDIEDATLDDVKEFFTKYYKPSNAYLSIAGNIGLSEVKDLCQKWYGSIPSSSKPIKNIPQEPEQKEARHLDIRSQVPTSAIYKAYQMCDRLNPQYYNIDMMTDLIGQGKSSRLYKELVQEKNIFSSISCYQMGSIDRGMVVINGMLRDNGKLDEANQAIENVIEKFISEKVDDRELEKVKNNIESSQIWEDIDLVGRANSLSWYSLLGDTELVNTEIDIYNRIDSGQILNASQEVFRPQNCSTMYYIAEN